MHNATTLAWLDGLLPHAAVLRINEMDELQCLYAGIGLPALRISKMAKAQGLSTYHQIRDANPLRAMTESTRVRTHYADLRIAAIDLDADALNDLGWLWLNGSRLPADHGLARRLLKLAAVQGSAEALFNLGEQSYYGKGVAIDPNLAIDYYEQAHAQGIVCAAHALGSLFEAGDEGLVADHHKAHEWYLRGAQEQDLQACFALGLLTLDPQSCAYDQATGMYWLQSAAIQGHRMACERLVEMYESPFDSPPDPDGLLHLFWRDLAASLEKAQEQTDVVV